MMKTARVFVVGFVQSVGFRSFVKKKARELGLFGWVRNLPDGRIEIIFQGQKEVIGEMISICRKGPFLSEVKEVEVIWEEVKEIYKTFDIKF